MLKTIYKTTTSIVDAGLNFILSDPTEDAYHDVVGDLTHPMLGWDYESVFGPNPITLLGHNSDAPIGVWENTHVANGALRARLRLAPRGSTRIADEARALLEAGILKGVSVGFRPVKSAPRPGGVGIHYQRMILCEASICAIPANPAALLQAREMGISMETIQKVFRRDETSDDLTIGQRIRKARRAVRRAKMHKADADTPHKRAIWARAIAVFEREEHRLRESMRTAMPKTREADRLAHAREVRAKALALLKKIDARIAQDEAKSAVGQQRQHEAETIAAFSRHAKAYLDPPKQKFEVQGQTWRGVALPPVTWRGRKI